MTDFRALCAELLAALEFQLDDLRFNNRLCIRARTALAEPQGPAKKCWLDDEPDFCPSPCVFDDPQETIDNCTYARKLHVEGKCKTDCQYYQPTSKDA